MAVLESIRKRGGIIVSIVIGLALLAFIIGDFVPKGNSNYDIAKINGTVFSYQDYEQKIEELTKNEQAMYEASGQSGSLSERALDMIRERAWQQLISEVITQQEYEKLGLTVSAEELFDLIQGPNPSQSIRSIRAFTNPQTGEFDRASLINFLKSKDVQGNEAAARDWGMLERELLKERYVQKYFSLIAKGIYMPAFVVANENVEINKQVDFDYIIQPYASIPDSSIKITDTDLKQYYLENKQQWEQTTSRDIEYVAFEIVPSAEDRAAADQWIAQIKPEFEQAEDARQFVTLNSHVPFDGKFYVQEQLPVQVTALFQANEGDIIGPYQEGNTLKLVRLAKIEDRPDSVKIRQIVIRPREQTQASAQQAVALADSIKAALEGGANFTSLAYKYSVDPEVRTNDGDLGWIHESVYSAGSAILQCFELKKGEVMRLETNQALFIMQVTDRGKEVKKVQIATLQYNILPSSRTEQILYSQASKLAMENRTEAKFTEAANNQNLTKRVASYLGENDRQIPGLLSARSIVRWAYGAKKGEVSDVFSLTDAYVVAILKEVRKAGSASLEQVREEVSIAVRKQKKAAQIAANLSEAAKNADSFGDVALKLGLPVESASAITFSSFSVPGAGIEPQLIAAATSLGEGNISQPLEGSNGVFLLTVKQITQPDEQALEAVKVRLATGTGNRAMSEPLQAVHKVADIKDMRSKFY